MHVRDGTLNTDDLAWYEGCAEWMPLSNIPGVSLPTRPSPPPPPAPTASQQPSTVAPTEAPALWNPAACVNWSLLFTPIFGSLLLWRNYRTLNNNSKARKALLWAGVGIALALISLFVREHAASLLYVLLIPWYILVARPQMKQVKEQFDSTYPKKQWWQPIGIAAAGLVVYGVLKSLIFPSQELQTDDNPKTAESSAVASQVQRQKPTVDDPKAAQPSTVPSQVQRQEVDSSIAAVKGGVLELDKSTTLGKAFDSYRYFTTTVWTPSTDAAGRKIVEAAGTINFTKLTEKDIAIALGRANNMPPEESATNQMALTQARTILPNVQKRFKGAQLVFQFVINLDNTFELKGAKVNIVANDNKVASTPLDGQLPQENLKDIYDGHFPVFFIGFLVMAGN